MNVSRTVSRLSAGPAVCGRYRFLYVCTVSQLGTVFARASRTTPGSDATFSIWTGGRIVLEQSLHSRVALRVPVDIYTALRRPRVLAGSEQFWLAPKVSASLGLSVVTFF